MSLLSASSMGSTAFQKGLGAIHSLSHPVNSKFNIHHGLSNAIFMPYVLSFNRNEIEHKIIEICDYLNLNKSFESFFRVDFRIEKRFEYPSQTIRCYGLQ